VFSGFPAELRKQGLHADARTLLQLYRLMSAGIIKDLGALYSGAERLIVKDPTERGPYTIAFFQHFLEIRIQPGQSLDDAIIRSDTFYDWRMKHAAGKPPTHELMDEFLDSVFQSTTGFEGIVGAAEKSAHAAGKTAIPFFADSMLPEEITADHSDEEIAELLRKMKEIAERQDKAHRGGQKYVGNEGTSPYGHNGAAVGGIRVGGSGARHSARMVLNDLRYFPVDMNATLTDNNVDAALAALKGVAERHSKVELDIPETISLGAKRGGLFLPHLRRAEEDQLYVILFIDNGGFSMDVHIPVVRTLFKKMKTRYTHDLRTFYFHNIIDEYVYADVARVREPVSVASLLKEGMHHSVFFLGDASMAPYELHSSAHGMSGFDYLKAMTEAFPKIAWLNPVRESSWYGTETIGDIRSVIEMFPLTPRGIERAVQHMNRNSARRIEEK
jgi:uncharacterized protein